MSSEEIALALIKKLENGEVYISRSAMATSLHLRRDKHFDAVVAALLKADRIVKVQKDVYRIAKEYLSPPNPAIPGWLGQLSEGQRERVFVCMREKDNYIQTLLGEHRKLSAPYGTIPVGGAHIDPMAKAYGLEAMHRALNKGSSINDGVEAGKLEARLTILKWNASRPRDYMVQRPETLVDSYLEEYARVLRRAVDNQ